MAAKDFTPVGSVFSRLTVTGEPFRRGKDGIWHVPCRCSCGNETAVSCAYLKKGHSRSCGCLARENASERMHARKKHGHRWNQDQTTSPTYRSWRNARDRCLNPKAPNYSEYGGRGIQFCERWGDFTAFLADMGERPAGMSLDRYPDVNGNYEPDNCRWATAKEQAANRRNSVWIEVDGVMTTTAEVARKMGVSTQVLFKRLKAGWSVERTVNTPVIPKSRRIA